MSPGCLLRFIYVLYFVVLYYMATSKISTVMEACRTGMLDKVMSYVQDGGDVNARDDVC